MNPTTFEYIKELERAGMIDPNCKTCKTLFYPSLEQGNKMYTIFAPRHKPLETCKSGKNNHCTCDSCF